MGFVRVAPNAVRYDSEAGKRRDVERQRVRSKASQQRRTGAIIVAVIVVPALAGIGWYRSQWPATTSSSAEPEPATERGVDSRPDPRQLAGPGSELPREPDLQENTRQGARPVTQVPSQPDDQRQTTVLEADRVADETAASEAAGRAEADRLAPLQLEAAARAEAERRAAEMAASEAAARAEADRLAAELQAAKEANERLAAQLTAVGVRGENGRPTAESSNAPAPVQTNPSTQPLPAAASSAPLPSAPSVEPLAAARFFSAVAGRWERREERNQSDLRREVTEEELTIGPNCSGRLRRTVKTQSRGFAGWSDTSNDVNEYGFRCDAGGHFTGEISGEIAPLDSGLLFGGNAFRR